MQAVYSGGNAPTDKQLALAHENIKTNWSPEALTDAASFIEAGIPAVEFGPSGAGHHGPDEFVSVSSLALYRRALGDFVRALPAWLDGAAAANGLTAIDGGLA